MHMHGVRYEFHELQFFLDGFVQCSAKATSVPSFLFFFPDETECFRLRMLKSHIISLYFRFLQQKF